MLGPFSRLPLLKLLFLPVGLVLLVPLGVAAESPSFGDSNGVSNQNGAVAGILVLRNGNVLSGHVIRLSDHYQIEMPNGQLRVPVNQVEMFCHNLDEAYAERRRVRIGSTADSHLELAQWCLRLNLYEHTARELSDARAIDPGHRKLARLERQLQHILQSNEARRITKSSTHNPTATLATNVASPQSREDSNASRRVPLRTRAMFVRQIQPMLVKSCAATGCHQTGSARKWQLNRLALHGAGHPQATLTNLESTLTQVDWQVPRESTLVDFARQPHGILGEGASQPLRLRQLQLLRGWLEQLAASDEALELEEAYANPVVKHPLPKVASKIPMSARSSQGVRTAGAEIQDPFDPKYFNRQYGRTAKPANEQSQPDEQIDQAAEELP